MDKTKIIIDADTGTDDAVAITALLLDPRFDVLGITAVHGNRGVDFTTDNALRLVEFLGKDIPVFKGCSHSLVRDILPGRDINPRKQARSAVLDGKTIGIHDEVMEELPATTRTANSKNAVSFIVETLKNADEKISLVAVGPLTNIAAALILDRSIVEKIDTLYIMGGQLYGGNRTPSAEANFYDDPEAAHLVLTSGINIVLTPMEPSFGGAFDANFFATCDEIDTDTAKFIKTLSQNFIRRMKALGIYPADKTSCGMNDWGAVIPLVLPEAVLETEDALCQVETAGGFSDGMLIVDRRIFIKEPKNVKIIRSFDGEMAKSFYLDLLRKSR